MYKLIKKQINFFVALTYFVVAPHEVTLVGLGLWGQMINPPRGEIFKTSTTYLYVS